MSQWCAWSTFAVCSEWTPPSTNGLLPENLRAPISFIHYGTFVYPTIIALTAGSGNTEFCFGFVLQAVIVFHLH